MAASSETSFFWDRLIPAAYSIGATVVILGAMGKIMHYSWADVMLPIGLGTEAVIFLVYALQVFLRPETNYAWEKVHPELDPNFKGDLPNRNIASGQSLTSKMNDALEGSHMSTTVLDQLKHSFSKLTDTVGNLTDLSEATVATKDYAANMRAAATQAGDMSKQFGSAISAVGAMADVTKDANEYRSQFQKVAQNLNSLNTVYELELQDAKKNLTALNQYYGSLGKALANVDSATAEAQAFKGEIAKLTQNLNSLNGVYGSMLTAMRS